MLVIVLLAVAATAPSVAGVQVIPVRGGEIHVPDFDPERYDDSDSCQLALNAALNELSRQLGSIPFPPPGEPGYHEWANAIGAQMAVLNQARTVCLALGAPGRIATPQQARQFAVTALPVARQFVTLRKRIAAAKGRPARQASLALGGLRLAIRMDGRADLGALRAQQSFQRRNVAPAKVPTGQLKQLPAFAGAIQEISDWDKEVVEKTELKAATDPQLQENLDLYAMDRYGKRYNELTLAERRNIVTLPGVRTQSGEVFNLLNLVRQAGAIGVRLQFAPKR